MKRIPRTPFEALPPELAEALRPRVERLGYLGEFFQAAAQQPKALLSFMALTDDLKEALSDDVTEVVALTVAGHHGNDYERHQHERLCRTLGFGDAWIRAVEALDPDRAKPLTAEQRLAQRFTLAVLARRGHGVERIFDELVDAVGAAAAMAVLMLVGRYVTHALIVNALALEPPVASIFPDPRPGGCTPLWISEADVRASLDLEDALAALEDGLRREARGEAINMVKTHASWNSGSTLHAIGAVFPAEGFAGTKTWAHTKGGAAPVLALFDSRDGRLLALIDAFALGQLRTGGMSGVATRWLAAEDAAELAIAGSGKQALMQVRAVAAVRPLRRIRVWSPTAEHRASFAAQLRAELDLEVIEARSADEAVEGAPVVTLATRAREPFLRAEAVARGAHVNAVGAITPERAELEPALLGRCDVATTDSVASAQKLSSELRDWFEPRGWEGLQPLSEIVAGERRRPPGADVTLFKAMGVGVADLALAVEVYRRLK